MCKFLFVLLFSVCSLLECSAQMLEPMGWKAFSANQAETPTLGDRAVAIDGDTLFVGTSNGVYFYDQQNGWKPYALQGVNIRQLFKNENHILFEAFDAGNTTQVYCSADWGKTYSKRMPDRNEYQYYLNLTPYSQFPGRFYLGGAIGRKYSWYRTEDFGETWNILDPVFENGKKWGGKTIGVPTFAVSPSDNDHILAFGIDGTWDCCVGYLFFSDDGFETVRDLWTDSHSRHNPIFLAASFCPDNDKIMLGASTQGIHRSVDGGETWDVVLQHELKYEKRTMYWHVIFDNTRPGVAYALSKSKNSVLLAISRDYGETWTTLVDSLTDFQGTWFLLTDEWLLLPSYCMTTPEACSNELYRMNIDALLTSVSHPKFPDSEQIAPVSAGRKGVYDLQGRRVMDTAPKGVYIVNGKKGEVR